MFKSAALAGLLASQWAFAQSATTTPVPHGTPVPGDYTGPLRPQVHFSPPINFMNDPNGMFKDANGTWHLYYQYDATGVVAGNQHWGHATSKDLYTWVNQPIAIFPVNASSYIFSGSAVIDPNNTSGFFPNQDNGVVAIYTQATYEPILLQTQYIAYSRDGGYTFTPYEGNPVIDIGSSQFRDPKVIWYQDHWAMVVSHAQDFVISIYTSPDLKNWTFASNFSHWGYLGYQYECPNLVEVPYADSDKSVWLLQISINPKAPQGGSFSEYFLGNFDGYTFSPIDNVTRFTDFGKDAYAGQFFYNTPGEAVSIAWASNWQYSQVVPTGYLEGWRSSMGMPRSISIRYDPRSGIQAADLPYDMTPILDEILAEKTMGNGTMAVDFASVYSNAVYLEANVTGIPSANTSGTLNFTFVGPITGEYLRGGFFFGGDNYLWLDRGGVKGFDNPFFTDKFATNQIFNDTLNMRVVIDRSLIEIWLQDGLQTATTSFFPKEPLTILSVGVAGVPAGQNTSVRVTALKSTWQPQENEQGVVVGNLTMASNATSYGKRWHNRVNYKAEF